ncbi:MAG: hypothetical protein RBU23_00970 [Candidatus Auribacterota bacterium]|jgi:hypothetical protein|nr:hypothetical protein [Candidatus Auribacterota bacterium]
MKKLFGFLVFVGIIVFGAIYFRNLLTKIAVEQAVKSQTGLKMEIQDMDLGLRGTYVGINALKLYNPITYSDPVMISIPEVYVDYVLMSFLTDTIHFEEIRIDVDEFTVVKNKDGSVNVKEIEIPKSEETKAPEKTEKKKEGPGKTLKIDLFKLRIGRVVYKDYTKGDQPSEQVFNININEEFTNVTNLNSIVAFITFKALINTRIPQLAGIDLAPFQNTVTEALSQSKQILEEKMQQGKEQIDAAKQKMQETSEKMSGSIEDSKQQLEELSESAKQQIEDSKKQINDLFNLKKSTSGE